MKTHIYSPLPPWPGLHPGPGASHLQLSLVASDDLGPAGVGGGDDLGPAGVGGGDAPANLGPRAPRGRSRHTYCFRFIQSKYSYDDVRGGPFFHVVCLFSLINPSQNSPRRQTKYAFNVWFVAFWVSGLNKYIAIGSTSCKTTGLSFELVSRGTISPRSPNCRKDLLT